jgi:hypothetical protein
VADQPVRWSQGAGDAPPALRDLLQAARHDVPSKAELGSLESKLGALLDAPPAAAPLPGGSGSGNAPALAKLAVLVAVGGLVGTGAWLAARDEAAPPAPAPHVVPIEPAPSDTKAAPPPSLEPSAAVERPETAEEVEPAAPKPTAQRKPAPARTKPSEASLLSQAQQALKKDPKRALALTREHKRLYPQGELSQEREVIAIEALSRLDQKSSAEQKAHEFSEKYPESAHQKKVDTTLKK